MKRLVLLLGLCCCFFVGCSADTTKKPATPAPTTTPSDTAAPADGGTENTGTEDATK